jgi:hypothetical protein
VIIGDACGGGDEAAAQRSLESLRFAGDAIISDTETFTDLLEQLDTGVDPASGTGRDCGDRLLDADPMASPEAGASSSATRLRLRVPFVRGRENAPIAMRSGSS